MILCPLFHNEIFSSSSQACPLHSDVKKKKKLEKSFSLFSFIFFTDTHTSISQIENKTTVIHSHILVQFSQRRDAGHAAATCLFAGLLFSLQFLF